MHWPVINMMHEVHGYEQSEGYKIEDFILM
jgi:hypothetical protein